jgi:hypothetical protein
MQKVIAIFGCLALMLICSGPVSACGESLFRVGKGVMYREYTAPLPGKILIVASGENEIAFAQLLARAGHEITVVPSPEEVSDRLVSERFDIVMSHYHDHSVVNQQVELAGVAVVQLPVASPGEAELAREINPYAPMVDDSIKRFLKSIHRNLKLARA